jgi:UDP-N-acetylglucosamine acyltransferase
MTKIHPTAIIHSSARIGDDVEIGPYCVIGPDVEVGDGTILHNHVTIAALTTVGRDNRAYPFSVIGADPQDRKYSGERSVCTVGDRNSIREHVTIHRVPANGGGVTAVGSDNLIMVAAHIAHDCIINDHVCIANQVMLAGHVRIEEGANIGGGAGLHHFATIGACSFVGGLARITKDVPPYMIVEGNPAEVRAVNSIAMTRRGYSPDHIDAVKEAYKRLYRDNGAPMAEKIEELRVEFASIPAVVRLCEALSRTAGGVHGRALEMQRGDNKRTITV